MKVLVVESQGHARRALVEGLESAGLIAAQSGTAADACSRLDGFAYDALVVEVRLPDGDGLDVLDRARSLYPNIRCVVLDGFGSIHHAVKALKRGAADYLIKPVETAKVIETLTGAPADVHHLVQAPVAPVASPIVVPADRRPQPLRASGIVGASPVMTKLFSVLERVAPLNSTVLIQGETGTGKELVARTIHDNSGRRDKAFVAFNAAAIPDGLAEAELFGHSKGAFTGAVQARVGRFELADGGTLFIDEVSSMSLGLQAKLLRALQEREIERVGTSKPMKINTRVVAASNVDLRDMVRAGTFREDLFYRLNVVAVNLPPLRDRTQDVVALANHFVEVSCRENQLAPKTLSQATLQALMEFSWPGNVRHLQNAIEHAVAMSGLEAVIEPDTLPEDVLTGMHVAPMTPAATGPAAIAGPGLARVPMPVMPEEGINFASTMSHIERELILRYLNKAGGNKRRAARLLNLSRTTLIDKLHRLGVTEPSAAEPADESIRAIA